MGLKTFISIVAFCCILYTFIPKKQTKKPSELIQLAIDDTIFFEDTKAKLQKFLRETTFDELVEKSVKPAADKIASVRKQLEIYEGMERIPEGPQNFMTTSTAVLEDIYTQLLEWEKKYRIATHRMQKRWPVLLDLVEVVQRKISFLYSDEFFEPLNEFQIHFQPMDYEDPERKLQQQHARETPLPVSIVLEVIKTELLPSIKRFEALKLERGQPPKLDVKKELATRDPKMISILADLIPHLRMYIGHYNKLGEHWTQLLKDIKLFTNSAVEKGEKSKVKYEDLVSGMDREITNLKERIRNLKGPKKNTDL